MCGLGHARIVAGLLLKVTAFSFLKFPFPLCVKTYHMLNFVIFVKMSYTPTAQMLKVRVYCELVL